MAKYRPILTRIWKDPNFEKYNSSMKLIFLYLCTNELTTESGIYAISTKTISQETNIPEPTVKKLLSNGLKNLKYDFTNNCVFVKNFLKYNGGGSPDLVRRSIRKNYDEFDTPLWNEFINKYPEYSNGLQTVDKPLSNGSIEIELEIDNRNSNKGVVKGKIPYQEIMDLYNGTCKGLVEVTELTDIRKNNITYRWNKFATRKDKESNQVGIIIFEELFNRVKDSDFLSGRIEDKRNVKKSWKANFDWILKEQNFVSILEGKYDN